MDATDVIERGTCGGRKRVTAGFEKALFGDLCAGGWHDGRSFDGVGNRNGRRL